MSDVFIEVNVDRVAKTGIERAVQLLFGDPGCWADEGRIRHADGDSNGHHVHRTRPPTGAVILNSDGEVLAAGSNHHPLDKDTPAFDAGALDVRQLAEATLDAVRENFNEEARRDFNADPSGYVATLFRGSLKTSDLRAITEYQRAVHAEMNALVSAMRQRVDVTGAMVFVTSYPCHHCAKHLLALGLNVVYLEPYAKGRAAAMYGDSATAAFVPFTGVAPVASRTGSWRAGTPTVRTRRA